jgi:Co/Zn/Cd efflux system component
MGDTAHWAINHRHDDRTGRVDHGRGEGDEVERLLEVVDEPESSASQRREKRKLLVVIVLCFGFFLVELIGGLWARSLAIQSDSYHLLNGAFWLMLLDQERGRGYS